MLSRVILHVISTVYNSMKKYNMEILFQNNFLKTILHVLNNLFKIILRSYFFSL